MNGGFTGKYAEVDLTAGSSEVVEPGEKFYKDPGPQNPALISPQRGGAYLRLRME